MRVLLGSFYCFIFTFLIYKVEQEFVNRDIFRIKEISFHGNFQLTKEEFKKLGNSLYDKNIFNLNLDSIEEKIRGDIRVENAQITSASIGKININIKEKEPKFYVNIENTLYSVDKNGEIFAQMQEHKIENLPIIFVQEEEELLKVVKILGNIDDDELSNMISQVYYKNELEIELLIGEETLLKTNIEVPNFKYKMAKNLYLDLIQNQKIEYIDLRFDGYIVKNSGVGASGKR